MRARPVPDSLRGRPVVLFDDIVTTGATVREGARALREQGWSVHGAATIAATPLRNAARLSESTAVLQDSSGNRLERLAKEG
jgi:orotate phosphoribosyltransferase